MHERVDRTIAVAADRLLVAVEREARGQRLDAAVSDVVLRAMVARKAGRSRSVGAMRGRTVGVDGFGRKRTRVRAGRSEEAVNELVECCGPDPKFAG